MHILPPCVHLYSDIFQGEILHLDDMDEIKAKKKNEKEKLLQEAKTVGQRPNLLFLSRQTTQELVY